MQDKQKNKLEIFTDTILVIKGIRVEYEFGPPLREHSVMQGPVHHVFEWMEVSTRAWFRDAMACSGMNAHLS